MTLDNKVETENTITYLRTVADMLENGTYALDELAIRCESLNWQIEREEINLQLLKVVSNG